MASYYSANTKHAYPRLKEAIFTESKPEHLWRNEFMDESKADYVIIVDTDEVILSKDIPSLIMAINSGKYEVGLCGIINYLGPSEVPLMPQTHCPVVFVNRSKRFYSNRCINPLGDARYFDFPIHHLWFIGREDKVKEYEKHDPIEYEKNVNRYGLITKTINTPIEVLDIMSRMGVVHK